MPEQKAPRPKDPIWDTLVEVCGAETSEMTPSERGKYNKAVKELKAVGATPPAIRARARVYAQKYTGIQVTPNGLVAHWSECRPADNQYMRPPPPQPQILPSKCRHGNTGRCMQCLKDVMAMMEKVGNAPKEAKEDDAKEQG